MGIYREIEINRVSPATGPFGHRGEDRAEAVCEALEGLLQ